MTANSIETIAAIATPPGRGGIGILRVSGVIVEEIAYKITGKKLVPRHTSFTQFVDASGQSIDQGIAVFFPAPGSYTGEPTLELHAHGNPVVLDLLLSRVLDLGARVARPGEFTERAFLNGKLDLSQAEAVADLIASTNETQARLASRTLQGALAEQVRSIQSRLTRQRVRIEAELDFSEEDIVSDAYASCVHNLDYIIEAIDNLLLQSHQGSRVRDGMTVVIAGHANAGKSSVMNRVSRQELAIVTPLPGTTRDLLHNHIHLDGMPLHLIDTAGIRDSQDLIEQEGIRRAQSQIKQADLVLWVYDAAVEDRPKPGSLHQFLTQCPITLVRNKIDLTGEQPGVTQAKESALPWPEIRLSASTGQGLTELENHLKERAGYQGSTETSFLVRRRHIDALERTRSQMVLALDNLMAEQPIEIIAEDLRQAQNALGEITGEFYCDDLLGEIFATFCIGK